MQEQCPDVVPPPTDILVIQSLEYVNLVVDDLVLTLDALLEYDLYCDLEAVSCSPSRDLYFSKSALAECPAEYELLLLFV